MVFTDDREDINSFALNGTSLPPRLDTFRSTVPGLQKNPDYGAC